MTRSETFGVSTLLLILAIVLGAFLTSAGKYLQVTRFDLLDARQGERVMLDYERTIRRDFNATWRLDLYRNGVWVETAASPGVYRYRTTAALPPPGDLDLAWLAYGAPGFQKLPCGDYEAVLRWTIHPESVAMRRALEVRDSFTVICHAD